MKKEKTIVPRKLSFKEKRELDNLSLEIEKMESEQEELYHQLADYAFYQKTPQEINFAKVRSEELSEKLEKAYQRWEYLEELSL